MEHGKIAEEVFNISRLYLSINDKAILRDITISIPKNSVFGIMGPSGSGKSTLLKVLNRLIEIYDSKIEIAGQVLYFGKDIFQMDPTKLRKEVSMVFQQPNPFPHLSIYDNIAYPLKSHGIKEKREVRKIVEDSLRKVGLWNEVKDRLNSPASQLSGGQQQRLTIARALALKPKVLLMDEPTSMVDIVNSQAIEKLIIGLKNEITIVIVSHNPQQVARVADYVAFLYNGELIEWGLVKEIFTSPKNELTEKYVIGRIS
ncbi:phosphate ABC transporter ATP-binding protein [Saccharolobus solfataricus]|uniref:Phosphate ABC transporter ATP-binding protein n=2 Tax=Saccharolobus solfataricus TaxID=2287 RepID=A0A0E3K5W1_SACSO|nr:ATP-binding cassette domain-containing protein [Saccharolobus solfataricus]AKA73783.1 phosphate ABC transporter ATP-binding protein [Saccharolobus solfataricus]AKA76480.1 phosphate ABC transporter ATP-binding protein [Saccharolobus solfataricus]AKA79173.1 phosphate ABC transporter ATP-binding protein [Saccharolobus solfataricus]AZF68258.1 phosphate ABC transporter ATP-binding protein [Saccharolobus solfataricus]AZF70878.1 phosphate ABC transporter ATP-binding protein [Saccharolobus solfatar